MATYTNIEQIILDVFKHELSDFTNLKLLPIFPDYKPPKNDTLLYVSVSLVDSKEISTSNEKISTNTGYQEKLIIQFSDVFSINIYSRNNDAFNARNRLRFALISTYSRQMQELYGVFLPKQSLSFVNTTEFAENSTSVLNRFTSTIRVNYSQIVQKDIDYFDTFSQQGLIQY